MKHARKNNGIALRGSSKTNKPKFNFRDTPLTNGLSNAVKKQVVLNNLGPTDTQSQ